MYLALDPIDKYMENYRIFITDQVKISVIGKDSGTNGKQVIETPNEFGEAFILYKPQDEKDGQIEVDVDEDQKKQQEEQLLQIVDERLKEIQLVAQKVSATHSNS